MVRVINRRIDQLERKQQAARGVVVKRKNPSLSTKFPNGIHK